MKKSFVSKLSGKLDVLGIRRDSPLTPSSDNGGLFEEETLMSQIFTACNTTQVREFVPERRAFRIQGHSTTIRLERAFWTVLEEICREQGLTMPGLINQVYCNCLVANDKNLASCLRVICVKYLNVGAY